MIIIPAIDLKDGKCVRLLQGDYNAVTEYSSSPIHQAQEWQKQGAELIHIVDLDGAKDGISKNFEVIKEIIKNINVPIELGGGIRTLKTIEQLLNIGVKYIIIGTAAVKDKNFLTYCLKNYSDYITIGIDAKNDYIAIDGWQNITKLNFVEFSKLICDLGCRRIIYTDISRDGMLNSPNFDNTANLADAVLQFNTEIIASGGVGALDDIKKIKELNRPNITGIIIGKALYEKKIRLTDAISIFQNIR